MEGREFWFDAALTAKHDSAGTFTGVTAVVRNITVQKRMEDVWITLRHLSRRLNETLEMSAIGPIVAEEARRLFDYDAFSLDLVDEATGMLVGIYNEDTPVSGEAPVPVPTISHPLGEMKNHKALEGEAQIINRKRVPMIAKDKLFGSKRPSRSLLYVPIMREGRVMGVLSVQSYTVNKYGEEDLSLLETFANHVNGALARAQQQKALKKAFLDAKQGAKVKTLFLANMSHEIRTPLNAILGFTDLIEASTHHVVGEEEKGFFKTVRNNGNRLMRTVHEILDISQIEAGTYDLNMEGLELCDLVRDIVSECRPMAEEKSLTLECTTDLDSAFIHADKYGVSQAISNLIDNAIKYTEQGKITVSLQQRSENYVLTIQDTGIGISEEYLDSLFEAFSQESEGYTKKFQGIGLGMSIAKRHLDLNNIDIDVESTKGVGTTFTLTFKSVKKRIYKKQVKEEETKVTPIPEPIRKPLVLVVEDDHSSQKLTEYFLKGTHDLCFAVSVEEAKQRLKKYPVESVLLDLSLVGNEDGLDLVRWMRKTKTWQKTPVIATTAHAFTKDRNNCLAAGCNDYLSKPIKREKLIEKISKFVQYELAL